ncbi:GIT1 [Brettanomyces bruxellensis]|uniref:DEBR0S1_00364g1_1 n=1 Tax=Dekkera bruxellensis TaxID=5007 RepID=A0A7D9GWV5_DEKBR|nr:GIT1 [Brettanomyces bruxellensis]
MGLQKGTIDIPREIVIERSPDEEQGVERPRKESYWKALIAVFTAGCAFMSDGYQQGIMTPINLVLKRAYPEYTSKYSTMVSNSNLVANIIGQIFFGLFVDRIGRKQGFTITTSFIIIGSVIAACSKGSTQIAMFWMLTIARGITGFGIGGEYPTSAASAMEAADEKLSNRKKLVPFILATNFPISFGLPFASCIFLIFLSIWGEDHLSGVWRSCFGFGAVFPTIIFYFRWRMDHAKMFKKNAIKRKVPYSLILKKYWKPLLGVSGVWFIMDFVIYPNNIFSSSVLSVVIPKASVKKTAEWLLLLGSFATFGACFGMLINRWFTRKQIIIMGFFSYGVISIIVGAAFEKLAKIPALFVIFYGLMSFVIYAGPANMQSVVSSESFPTCIRGTLYGLSAGIGKAGAAIGTEIFTPIQTHAGTKYTFFLSGGLSLIGCLFAYFIIVNTDKYDLAEKDEKFNQYLVEQGWKGFIGESNEKQKLGVED